MAPANVLQVVPEVDPGGAERIVLSLARLLPPERFRVSVAALDGRGRLGGAFRDAGCTVHDLGARGRWSPGAAGRLRRLIRSTGPAIVHSHLFRAHLAAARAVRGNRPPVTLATEHQADPRRWALGVLRWATRRTTLVTAVSEGVRAHLVAHGFAPQRVRTVLNGIDVEAAGGAAARSPAELGLPEGAQAVLFAGRLMRQKGLDVLLCAVSRVAADLPSLHLLVAGDGPHRGQLETQSAALGLRGRVHFLGWRDDMPRVMRSACAAVLPSRWEGLSLVLLEAMAAGLPVVATSVEGHAEVLEPDVTGLLVAPDDAGALAGALRRLLSDAALSGRLGAAAGEVVRRRHTAEAMASRYAALYAELLKGVSARRGRSAPGQ